MLKLTAAARRERLRNAERLRHLVRRSRPLSVLPAPVALTWRAVLLAGTMLSAQALAQNLPQGGQVVGGSATIAQPSANQMLITQSTQRTAINWQSFNIGAGNGVQFVQPSSQAIAVNRVIGLGGPSQIIGSLTANGQVYIVNPQGVVFGKGAMVNTGALLATTRDINPAQFMAGGDITLSGGSTGAGKVVNKGTIATQPGGYVVLAGDKVVNKGTIDTPGGRTVLAAGDQATVALSNGQLVKVTMNASVANATVKNRGVIKAEGGKVVLSANGAGMVIGGAINLSGTVDVSAALAGDITVDAGRGGTVNATGATLKAVSTAGKGGCVTLAGDRVGLFDGTKVNVSGKTGGGTVLAGGGVQGKDASMRNASLTVMDPTSTIDASATGTGDGGMVVLWSNDYTGFYGTITAQGGPSGGKGGWVETSSHDNLQAWGSVVLGAGGEWLLDPSNVTIANANTANNNFNSSSGVWVPNATTATINAAAINAQLNNGTTVIVTTNSSSNATGNLNVNANITKTAGGNANLTLRANGTIFDNGAIISSTMGVLNVTMNASNGVVLSNGSAFSLNGGNLTIIGVSNAGLAGVNIGQTTINAGNVTINGTTNTGAAAVNVFGVLNATGTTRLVINGVNGTIASVNFGANVIANDLTVNAVAKGDGSGIVVGSTITSCGTVTLNGTGVGEGSGVLVTGTICSTGNMTLTGSAGDGVAVNLTGVLNASDGGVGITGTSVGGRGVRLSGAIAAAGRIDVAGTANNANGLAVPGSLTLTAAAGATLNGTANSSNGINITANINATGTSLTLNGRTVRGSDDMYGVNVSGATVAAANLTINGTACSTNNSVGGVLVSGASTLNANGALTINGNAVEGIAVNLMGTVNASGGNLTINGTATTGRGVRLSGTLASSGTVTVTGSADNANGIAVPGSLILAAAGGATFIGTANAANGINIAAALNATGTPLLTLNGTSARNGNLTFAGVNISAGVDAANLTIIGRGLSITDDTGGVFLNGTAALNAVGNVTLNGSAGDGTGVNLLGSVTTSNGSITIDGNAGSGIAVNLTGTLNSAGNISINGTSNNGRGVRLSGTIAAAGALTATGSSNTANGLAVPLNLTIAAAGGATLIGTASTANGLNVSATLDSTGTPLLTLNGTTTGDSGDFFGINVAGVVNAANLALVGHGVSLNEDIGGVNLTGSAFATGDLAILGTAGNGTGVNVSGAVNASGNVTINGTSSTERGVRLAGSIAAGGTVNVAGSSSTAAGIGVASNLTLAAAGGSTWTGSASAANGINISGFVEAGGTPLLVLNGTTTSNDGAVYGVNITGNLTVASIAVNGVGNLSATGNVGGAIVTGTLNATGDVTLSGQTGGTFAGVLFTGRVFSNGTIALNGTSRAAAGVNAGGTLNAAGTVTITGQSNTAAGVFVGGCLTLGGIPGGAIAGSTGTGQYGVLFTNASLVGSFGPLVITGTGGTSHGVALDGIVSGFAGGVTVNGNNSVGGIEASGLLNSNANVTLNANRITLNNASFGGAAGHVVLQALDTASAMSVDGSGASFGNVASVVIGGASQAADLNLAAPLTYAGGGNFTVATGAANILLNGSINASAGFGSVILSAGNGVPVNASQSNGNVTGGDVLVGSATGIASGAGGTVVIYSGNANSAAFAALVADGATSQTKAYAMLAGAGAVCTSSALNLFYRVAPSLSVTLGNATGANASKTYDGTGVALGFGVSGFIDGDTATSFNMTGGSLGSSLPLTGGQALHAGNYAISQGTATFAADHNYAVCVSNGTIDIAPKSLTVTAQGDSKVYDGTTASSATATVCGTIAGDSINATNLAQVFNNSHVLGIDGSTLNVTAPLTNGSFACSSAGSFITDYCVSYVTANGTITPKALTVTAQGGSKVYDGTTASNATATVCGTIAGDSFGNASLAEVYNNSHVLGANASTLNLATALTNASFASSTAGSYITDYDVSYVTASGTITPKALTVTATGASKIYDGRTASNATATVAGNIAGDSFSNASLVEVYGSSHVLGANGSTLNMAAPLTNGSFANSTAGSLITDYCVSYVTANGTITPKALTITAQGDGKVYDGTTASNATAAVCGTIAGDSFANASLAQLFNNSHVLGANGSTLNVAAPLTNGSFANSTAGSFITDYEVTYVTATGTITPKALTVTAAGGTKTYDGTMASNATATVCGTIAGDGFSNASLAEVYNNSHVLGTNASTLNVATALTNGSFAASTAGSFITDYDVTYVTAAGTITPRALTVTATTGTKVYDGTATSTAVATVTGNIAGDSFTAASLGESYGSIHVLGAGGSTLNVSAPLTNGSFAGSTAGSFVTDYAVLYVTASATIAPKALTVTATPDSKIFDGTVSSSKQMTVSGNIAGDSFTGGALTQVFASAAPAGTNNSLLIPATPFSNASFAASTSGSWITDYAITYTAAPGTILPSAGGGSGMPVVILPPNLISGLMSGNVLALGAWLNSGGLPQNIPAGLALNDNVLHLLFSTDSGGQPVIQASWEFFNPNFSGTINLPVNTSAPAP